MIGPHDFDLRLFLLFTAAIMGGAGFLTGQAVAGAWRPVWRTVVSCLFLVALDRFLVFALFGGALLWAPGWAGDGAVILAAGLCGWRLTQVRKMVAQYPWLYRRNGPFAWRRHDDRSQLQDETL